MSEHLVKMNVNFKDVEVKAASNERLIDVLRDKLGLKSVKEGCGAGVCGTCTVIMDGKTVSSCLVLAVQAEGKRIQTLESLGTREKLHPIQESFMNKGAVQCGFCTPGMIMTAKNFLDKNPNPTKDEVREAISGNLCRCTGYVKIVEAIQDAAQKMKR
jgi:carbon-monoxide dehydrogenase small subunit